MEYIEIEFDGGEEFVDEEEIDQEEINAAIRDASGFHFGQAFFELGKELDRRRLPIYPSEEEGIDAEVELIDAGVSAFALATGLSSYEGFNIPTVASLCITNSTFEKRLRGLVLETLSGLGVQQ